MWAPFGRRVALSVMAGFLPAIHVVGRNAVSNINARRDVLSADGRQPNRVDDRGKPGHDA
jgi:hypothetical protein